MYLRTWAHMTFFRLTRRRLSRGFRAQVFYRSAREIHKLLLQVGILVARGGPVVQSAMCAAPSYTASIARAETKPSQISLLGLSPASTRSHLRTIVQPHMFLQITPGLHFITFLGHPTEPTAGLYLSCRLNLRRSNSGGPIIVDELFPLLASLGYLAFPSRMCLYWLAKNLSTGLCEPCTHIECDEYIRKKVLTSCEGMDLGRRVGPSG